MEGSGGCGEGPERSILSQEKKKKYLIKILISMDKIMDNIMNYNA